MIDAVSHTYLSLNRTTREALVFLFVVCFSFVSEVVIVKMS